MNERVKYPLVITFICLVAATGLALTYAVTRDRIATAEKSELVEALDIVLPAEKKSVEERPIKGVTSAQPADEEKLYVAREKADKTGKVLGYAAIGTAQGYSSRIHVMVGVEPDVSTVRIIAIRILKQQETPGLGERSKEVPATKSIWEAIDDAFRGNGDGGEKREAPFQKQFRGKTVDKLVLVKEPNSKENISQITGATITSRAVVTAVKQAIEIIKANVPGR